MAVYDYRWALNWNVALGSLTNLEAISQIRFAPKSQPLDLYPIRRRTLSGKVYGTGTRTHFWLWDALPIASLEYILDSYLPSDAASAKMTIYTRLHDLGEYRRFNCWLERPQPGVHFRYDRKYARDLRLPFTGLIAL
jgi:hypothetical protein